MTSSTGQGWAQLRQQARQHEQQTEILFQQYSQYANMTNLPPKPSESEKRNEAEIEDLLSKRATLVDQLTRLLDSESALTASALKQNNLSRHREILLDHRQELKALRSSIAETRDRVNLLSNVRSDINAYRSSNPADAEADYMLEERGRLDRSHSAIDSVLSQAYAVNENFGIQRETLASINRRIVGAASQVPGLNSLMGRISAKRRRDGIILGSFIGICFFFLLFFR